jgi:hypothetical protein
MGAGAALATERCQPDVHGLVAAQAVYQQDQAAVQDRVLAGEHLRGERRLTASEHPDTGAYRRAGGAAARRARSNPDLGLVVRKPG